MRKRREKPASKEKPGLSKKMEQKLARWLESAREAPGPKRRMASRKAIQTFLDNLKYRRKPDAAPGLKDARRGARLFDEHPSVVKDALWHDLDYHFRYGRWLPLGKMISVIEKFKRQDQALLDFVAEMQGIENPKRRALLKEAYLENKDKIRREEDKAYRELKANIPRDNPLREKVSHMKAFEMAIMAALREAELGRELSEEERSRLAGEILAQG